VFGRLEKTRINESVKINVEGYLFPVSIRATDMCTCRVSAVGVKLITFQCFHKYRVSQEECARLWEGVPYAKVYRYNPKHLCPKLNVYGDNGQ